ncbi:MAG TPA: cell wall hydrolase [Terracidiphilus sp.]|nr:cell wall hydrolase [Terracidiphilus sp.]
MRVEDQTVLALCMWRENRGHGVEGMQSVANVIVNRAARWKSTVYWECVRPLQFSSMTAKNDPELSLWPRETDAEWAQALELAAQAAAGTLEDITDGALYYYAPRSIKTTKAIEWLDGTTVPFPESWDAQVVKPLCAIGGQLFFR